MNMKKSMLWVAMAAVAMTSCQKNEFEGPNGPAGNQLAAIRVGQEVAGLQTTKAAINTGDQVEALIIATKGPVPADWAQFVPVTANTFLEGATWDVLTFANTSVGTFTAGTNQPVSLNPLLYANPTGSAAQTGATLTGVAPVGDFASGKISFKVFDGQQDVMTTLTTEQIQVSGTDVKTINPFHLTFDHRTAQLRFMFAAMNTAGNDAWKEPITVKNVTIKNTSVPSAVRLIAEAVVDQAVVKHAVDWTKPQSLPLENFTSNELKQTFGTDVENKPDFITLDKVAMVKPGVGVVLDVTLVVNGAEKSFKDIKPTQVGGGTLTTKEGFFHNIRLTIKKPAVPDGTPEIVATATVTEWGEGDEGEAELK